MAIDRAKIKIMQKIAVLILLFFLVILVGAELRVNRVKGESADQHIGLVAILVEKENIFENQKEYGGLGFYAEKTLRQRVERYAKDVQATLALTKSLIIPVTKQEDPLKIAQALEKLYFDGDGTSGEINNLTGIVLVGEIPLPKVKKENYEFVSLFPYTDFANKSYLYNSATHQFEFNAAVTSPQPEVWHGVMRPPARDSEQAATMLAEFLDKNHAFHAGSGDSTAQIYPTEQVLATESGPAIYSNFEKSVFYADLFHEQEQLNQTQLPLYLGYLNFLEDRAYLRYTKKLLKAANDLVSPGTSADLALMPDIQTKDPIDKLLKRYVQVIESFLGEVNNLVNGAGRWTLEETDTPMTLISKKDELTKEYLLRFNSILEKRFNLIAEGLQRPFALLTKTEEPKWTLGIPHGESHDNFFNGIKGNAIEQAQQCSLGRGANNPNAFLAQQVEGNRTFDPDTKDDCDDYGGCCGKNMVIDMEAGTLSAEACNPKKATRPVFSIEGTRPLEEGALDFQNCLVPNVHGGTDYFSFGEALGGSKIVYVDGHLVYPAEKMDTYTVPLPIFPYIATLPVSPRQASFDSQSSLVVHAEPTYETIKKQLEQKTTLTLPVDKPHYLSYQDGAGKLIQKIYPNFFQFSDPTGKYELQTTRQALKAALERWQKDLEKEILLTNFHEFFRYLYLSKISSAKVAVNLFFDYAFSVPNLKEQEAVFLQKITEYLKTKLGVTYSPEEEYRYLLDYTREFLAGELDLESDLENITHQTFPSAGTWSSGNLRTFTLFYKNNGDTVIVDKEGYTKASLTTDQVSIRLKFSTVPLVEENYLEQDITSLQINWLADSVNWLHKDLNQKHTYILENYLSQIKAETETQEESSNHESYTDILPTKRRGYEAVYLVAQGDETGFGFDFSFNGKNEDSEYTEAQKEKTQAEEKQKQEKSAKEDEEDPCASQYNEENGAVMVWDWIGAISCWIEETLPPIIFPESSDLPPPEKSPPTGKPEKPSPPSPNSSNSGNPAGSASGSLVILTETKTLSAGVPVNLPLKVGVYDMHQELITTQNFTLQFKITAVTQTYGSIAQTKVTTQKGYVENILTTTGKAGVIHLIVRDTSRALSPALLELKVVNEVGPETLAEIVPQGLYTTLLGMPAGNVEQENYLGGKWLFSGLTQAVTTQTVSTMLPAIVLTITGEGGFSLEEVNDQTKDFQLEVKSNLEEPLQINLLEKTANTDYLRTFVIPPSGLQKEIVELPPETLQDQTLYLATLGTPGLSTEQAGEFLTLKFETTELLRINSSGRIALTDPDELTVLKPGEDDFPNHLELIVTMEEQPIAQIIYPFSKNKLGVLPTKDFDKLDSGIWSFLATTNSLYKLELQSLENGGRNLILKTTGGQGESPLGNSALSVEDALKEIGVGWQKDFKNELLFAAGNSVGEATRPYASEIMINLGDPTVKLARIQTNSDAAAWFSKQAKATETAPVYTKDLGALVYTADGKRILKILSFDYNADAQEDVLIGYAEGEIHLLHNYGGEHRYKDLGSVLYIADGLKDLDKGDFNHDNWPDLVLYSNQDKLGIVYNKKGDLNRETFEIETVSPVRSFKVADMDQDDYADLVVLTESGELLIFYGDKIGLAKNGKLVGQTGVTIGEGNFNNEPVVYYDGIPQKPDLNALNQGMREAGQKGLEAIKQLAQTIEGEKQKWESLTDYVTLAYSPAVRSADLSEANLEEVRQKAGAENAELLESFYAENAGNSSVSFDFGSTQTSLQTDFLHLNKATPLSSSKEKKDLNGGTLETGDLLEFTLKITNQAKQTIRRLAVADYLPANLEFKEDSLKCEGCDTASLLESDSADYPFIFYSFDLKPNQNISLTYQATLRASDYVNFFIADLEEKEDPYFDLAVRNSGDKTVKLTYYLSTGPREYQVGKEIEKPVGQTTECPTCVQDLKQQILDNPQGAVDQINQQGLKDSDGDGLPDAWDEINNPPPEDASNTQSYLFKKGLKNTSFVVPAPIKSGGIHSLSQRFFRPIQKVGAQAGSGDLNVDVSAEIGLDGLNGAISDITNKLEDFLKNACSGFGGGGLLNIPFNYDLLDLIGRGTPGFATSQIGPITVPGGFMPGYPIFGYPGIASLCSGPCVGPDCYICSTVRLYTTITATLGIGQAVCIGPYMTGIMTPPAVLTGNCFVWALPVDKLLEGALDDDGGDSGCKEEASNFSLEELLLNSAAGDFMGGISIGTRSGGSDLFGPNKRPISFPGILSDWLDRQMDEIINKLSDPISITLVVPSFKGIMTHVDANPTSDRNLPPPPKSGSWNTKAKATLSKGTKALNNFLDTLSSFPWLKLQHKNVTVRIPWPPIEQAKQMWAEFKQFIEAIKNLKKTLKAAWESAQNAVTKQVLGEILKTLDEIIQRVEQNIETLEAYKEFPTQLKKYKNFKVYYVGQMIDYLDKIITSTIGYVVKNKTRIEAWGHILDFNLSILIDLQDLFEFFKNLRLDCANCKNDRYNAMNWYWQLLSVLIPEIPIIPFPGLPDVTVDISHISGGIELTLPKIKFVPEEIKLPRLPTLPNLLLPHLNLDALIPLLPPLPALPDLPPLPPLPVPKLPDLPPAFKLPDIGIQLKVVLEPLENILKIICLIKNALFPIAEQNVKGTIMNLTERSDWFFPLDILLPDIPVPAIPFVSEIRADAYLNLKFDTTMIYDVVKKFADQINTLTWNFTSTTQNMLNESIYSSQVLDKIQAQVDTFKKPEEGVSDKYKLLAEKHPNVLKLKKLKKELTEEKSKLLEEIELLGSLEGQDWVNSPLFRRAFVGEPSLELASLNSGLQQLPPLIQPIEREVEPRKLVYEISSRENWLVQSGGSASGEKDVVQKNLSGFYTVNSEGKAEQLLNYVRENNSNSPLIPTQLTNTSDGNLLYAIGDNLYLKENQNSLPTKQYLKNTPVVQELATLLPTYPATNSFQVTDLQSEQVTLTWKSNLDPTITGYQINLKKIINHFDQEAKGDTNEEIVLRVNLPGQTTENNSQAVFQKTFLARIFASLFEEGPTEQTFELQNSEEPSLTLVLPYDNYYAKIRAVGSKGPGTSSEEILFYPQVFANAIAPVIEVKGGDTQQVGILQKVTLDVSSTFSTVGIEKYSWDLNEKEDSNQDGDPLNDPDVVTNGPTLTLGPLRQAGEQNICLIVTDVSGLSDRKQIRLEVIIPDVEINKVDLSEQGSLEGKLNPPFAEEPILTLRNRFDRWQKLVTPNNQIGIVLTDGSGEYTLAPLDNAPGIVVRAPDEHIIAEIHETRGTVVMLDSNYLAEPVFGTSSSPTSIKIVRQTDQREITRITLGGSKDQTLTIEGAYPSSGGITLNDANPEDNFKLKKLEQGDVAALYDYQTGHVFAYILANGNLLSKDAQLTLRLSPAKDIFAEQSWKIFFGPHPIAEVYLNPNQPILIK